MSEPLSQCVYGIYDTRSGECVYVGSTEGPARDLEAVRWARHVLATYNKTKCDRKLYTMMRRDGLKNFELRAIERYSGLTKDQLCAREQAYLDKLKPPCNMRRAMDANPRRRARRASYYRENPTKWKTYQETFKNKFRVTVSKPDPPQLTAMQLWLKDAVDKTSK